MSNVGWQIIGYTNGLIIVVLLLVIFLLLRRVHPGFCETCAHLLTEKQKWFLGRDRSCDEKCIYNPAFRGSAVEPYYERKKFSDL
jgi:hypothetical protein